MSKFINSYAKFLNKRLSLKKKLKVIIDCSNGTTGLIFKGIKHKNLETIIINGRPDGNFPAHGPNPLIPGAMDELKRRVKKDKADLGIIFDADGDRVFFVDEAGREVDAHEAGFILTQMFKSPFVVSEIASWRLKRMKNVFISQVGHYFFKNLMRKKKASLGLEHSGHFYFKEFFYCDSGIFSAIKIINFVSGLRFGLSVWLDALPEYYRSGEINFKVSDKEKMMKNIERIYRKKSKRVSHLDGATLEFKDWWFNLRPSNTENLLRLNVEVTDKKMLKEKLTELIGIIKL